MKFTKKVYTARVHLFTVHQPFRTSRITIRVLLTVVLYPGRGMCVKVERVVGSEGSDRGFILVEIEGSYSGIGSERGVILVERVVGSEGISLNYKDR